MKKTVEKLKLKKNIKDILKTIFIISIILLFTYIIIQLYLYKIDKINKNEIQVISESYKDR